MLSIKLCSIYLLKSTKFTEWKNVHTAFENLGCSLSLIDDDETPDDELMELIKLVINKFHFLLLQPQAPIMSLNQYHILIKQFCKNNLPCLLLLQLENITTEDRKKYTLSIINSIKLTRKEHYFREYVKNSQYIYYLLSGHECPESAQYCGRILEELMVETQIKRYILRNSYLIELAYNAYTSEEYLVQGQCLKTLKTCFQQNGAASLLKTTAIDFMAALVTISDRENLVLKVMSIEVLALLLLSQKKLRNIFARYTERIDELLKMLSTRCTQLQIAVLKLLSVLFIEEESIPAILHDNEHIIKDVLKKLTKKKVKVPLFCKL